MEWIGLEVKKSEFEIVLISKAPVYFVAIILIIKTDFVNKNERNII